MKATMTEVLNFVEGGRVLGIRSTATIMGGSECDDFSRIEISSGNSNPIGTVVAINCNEFEVAFKKSEDGMWSIVYDYWKEESEAVSDDGISRLFSFSMDK